MSARDILLHWGLNSREADEVLKEHARELANELRTRFEPDSPLNSAWAEGWLSAADYVDPDVTP